MLKTRFLVISLILTIAAGLILTGSSVFASHEALVDESSSGGHVSLQMGDTLIVELNQQSGSTGFVWELISNSDPSVLENVSHQTLPPVQLGGIGKDRWTFSALKAGTSTFYMEYSQPWPLGEKNARRFVLSVHVFDTLPAVPASSNLSLQLLIAGLAGTMFFIILRRLKTRSYP
jgi:predicted secreted protein